MENGPLTQLNHRKQILMPLIIVSLIMVAAMGWVFYVAQNLIEVGERKVQIEETRYKISGILNTVIDAETGQRGYLLTGRTEFLEPYEAAVKNIDRIQADLYTARSAFPNLDAPMSRLSVLIGQKFEIIERSLNLELNSGAYAPHLRLAKDQGRRVMDEIRLLLKSADDALVKEGKQIERKIISRLKQLALDRKSVV